MARLGSTLGSTLGEFWRRLSFLWNGRQIDRDLDEEMRFHLDKKARAAAETGTPGEEARRAAHLQFGGVTLWREICRDAWGWSSAERLLQDRAHAAPQPRIHRRGRTQQPARGSAAPDLPPCFSGHRRPGQPDLGSPRRG